MMCLEGDLLSPVGLLFESCFSFFMQHKKFKVLWNQAPFKASENQINHFYVKIRVYG